MDTRHRTQIQRTQRTTLSAYPRDTPELDTFIWTYSRSIYEQHQESVVRIEDILCLSTSGGGQFLRYDFPGPGEYIQSISGS
jgi:hypothetical protein